MIDTGAIKESMKVIFDADTTLKGLVGSIETTYTEPAKNGGQISILNGELSFEGYRTMFPVALIVRTRMPSRASSDARNDDIVKRVLELLTSSSRSRLNGTVSCLKTYGVEPFEVEEDLEVRALAITLLYEIIES